MSEKLSHGLELRWNGPQGHLATCAFAKGPSACDCGWHAYCNRNLAVPVGEPGRTPQDEWWKEEALDVIRHARVDGDPVTWERWRSSIINGLLKAFNRGQDVAAAPPAQGAPTPEILAKWMVQHSFSTGHGDSVEDLLNELSWQVKELRSGGESDKPRI